MYHASALKMRGPVSWNLRRTKAGDATSAAPSVIQPAAAIPGCVELVHQRAPRSPQLASLGKLLSCECRQGKIARQLAARLSINVLTDAWQRLQTAGGRLAQRRRRRWRAGCQAASNAALGAACSLSASGALSDAQGQRNSSWHARVLSASEVWSERRRRASRRAKTQGSLIGSENTRR